MGRSLICVLTVAVLASGQPRAETPPTAVRCPTPGERFTVLRGDLAPGRTCGSMILTTDASDSRLYLGGLYRHHSIARVAWREPMKAPFEVSLEWQLATPGRWTLELDGLGVVVLLGRDRLGFFVDDAQMMGTMFAELPGVGGPGRRAITLRRTLREIVVVVDGKEVGRKAVDEPAPGMIVVGLRGAPGHRSRALVRSFAVRALPLPP